MSPLLSDYVKTLWLIIMLFGSSAYAGSIRVASFNVSMEAGNYIGLDAKPEGNELFTLLAKGEHQQIRNIAEIIQRVRPDIILLNEFDFTPDNQSGVEAFLNNYLSKSQNGAEPIQYPHYFVAPSNTGVKSDVALNHSRKDNAPGNNAYGFGLYPGQYGMVLLSRFPIEKQQSRTFQTFLWKDMPDNRIRYIVDETGVPWYSKEAQSALRLSSKSHWDIKILVEGKPLHILASHPTPPVFDGPENRNGHRNHDEIRFWNDYIGPEVGSAYIYDDQGDKGGFSGERFVLLGDLNASPTEGDGFKEPIVNLINNQKIADTGLPTSSGGKLHSPDNKHAQHHTAAWRMTVDYALPSKSGLTVVDKGIFWPQSDSELSRLVADRAASSDHRLVWVDVRPE